MYFTHRSSGIIRYNPVVRNLAFGEWWLILECCPELARYYRYLFNYHNRSRFLIHDSAWGSHISVIRGEKPPNAEEWGRWAGEEIEFNHAHTFRSDERGVYFWLDVESDRLGDIREFYGLARKPVYSFHLTIGRRMDVTS